MLFRSLHKGPRPADEVLVEPGLALVDAHGDAAREAGILQIVPDAQLIQGVAALMAVSYTHLALSGVHPMELYRISRDNPAKLPGWRRYIYPIYTTYNGKCRKDALPMKF